MNSEPLLGAEGIEHFTAALLRAGRGHGTCRFPVSGDWSVQSTRCEVYNPTHFFRQLVRTASGIDAPDRNTVRSLIGSCQIAEGVAIFMDLSWIERSITRCSVQAVVAPNRDLEYLYWKRRGKSHYFRLDYSVEERGELFDHPFPHVHSVPEGQPRFHFHQNKDVFPAFALLDFIMRNRHYARWQRWFLNEYSTRHAGDLPDNSKTPEQLVEDYKVESEWMRSSSETRNRFLTGMKDAAVRALQAASEGLPKVDPELLKLNYWP